MPTTPRHDPILRGVVARKWSRDDVPSIPLSRDPIRVHNKITDAREEAYLTALAETGSKTAAAAAARSSDEPESGCSMMAWSMHAKRHPEFRAREVEALDAFKGRVEATIADRALNGTEKPVYHQGVRVDEGENRVYSDRLLLRVAERLDASWAPRRNVHVTGDIAIGVAMPADTRTAIAAMSSEQRQLLRQLCALGLEARGISIGADGAMTAPAAPRELAPGDDPIEDAEVVDFEASDADAG